MRTIKFRAWDINNKFMYTWHDIDVNDQDGILHLVDILKNPTKEGVIPMQFTGLHDKHGKEIYEGDVVKNEEGLHITVTYGIYLVDAFEIIGFNLCEFYGESEDIGKAIRLQNSIEIIGNIHEHSHLIT